MKFKNIFKSKTTQILAATLVLSVTACTNLDEEVRDEVFSDNTGGVESAVAAVYSRTSESLFVDNGGMLSMQEYSSDIAMLPTRGSDWGDGGKWRELHEFTWTPASLVPESNWNMLTNGITRALTAIYTIERSAADTPNRDLFLAESWCMYAFYTFHTIDLYGQAPYRYPDASVPASTPAPEAIQNAKLVVKQGPDAIDEIIGIVEKNLPALANLGDPQTHTGRFTKEAAYALLADMYLNRAVYKDRYNATSAFNFKEKAAGDDTGNDMDQVIKYTTLLIDNGPFSLESNYFANFDLNNNNGTEHIFVVTQNVNSNHPGDNDLAYMQVERNQKPSPLNRGTNGSCLTPEFFHSWDNFRDDPRFQRKYQYKSDGTVFNNDGTDVSVPAEDLVLGVKDAWWFHFNRGIMFGPQYGPKLDPKVSNTFVMVNGRVQIFPLVIDKNNALAMDFTPDMTFADNQYESVLNTSQLNQGARCFKWEFNPAGLAPSDNGVSQVNVPLYRLGGIYAMRAEAYLRNGDEAKALDDINMLRTSRTNEPFNGSVAGKALSSLDENALYRELGFELYYEMKRRPQMVRFGKADQPGTAKKATQPYRRIFPIPQSTMDVNKEFTQNDGY